MSEKMREQFEAWHLDRYCGGVERLRKCVNADDVYYHGDTQTRWVSWQASREAVMVELPDTTGMAERAAAGNEYSAIRIEQQARCRAAIEAQGLKVAS